MVSEQREGIKEGKIMDKVEAKEFLTDWIARYKDAAERNALAEEPDESAEYLISQLFEPKPDKIEWCPQHGYPLSCAKCGMPKPDKPSRLLTGNEWMDIWATGGDDEKHRRVYVDYLSGLIRQDDKTASLVRAEVGECIENNIRASILTDDGWVYTIPASLVERFKAGTMPDKD